MSLNTVALLVCLVRVIAWSIHLKSKYKFFITNFEKVVIFEFIIWIIGCLIARKWFAIPLLGIVGIFQISLFRYQLKSVATAQNRKNGFVVDNLRAKEEVIALNYFFLLTLCVPCIEYLGLSLFWH